jgi:cytochrome c-type biogenesis protein CcmH/NrfG
MAVDMPSLEVLRKFVEKSPNDAFARYGLAMELKKQGQSDEAEATFAELERRNPDYVPQYLMRANNLRDAGRAADARAVIERGIAAAGKKGDGHALGELQSALMALESPDD